MGEEDERPSKKQRRDENNETKESDIVRTLDLVDDIPVDKADEGFQNIVDDVVYNRDFKAESIGKVADVDIEEDKSMKIDTVAESIDNSPEEQIDGSVALPGIPDLQQLEQIYNFSDEDDDGYDDDPSVGIGEGHDIGNSSTGSDDSSDADGNDNLEQWQEEILNEMEKSLDYSPDSAETAEGYQLVSLSKEGSSTIRTELWRHGPIKFMDKYGTFPSSSGSIYSPAQILASLGFRLPINFISNISDERLAPFIRLAIRHTLSSRQRLPYPHTLDELCKVLETAQNVIVLTGAGISTSLGIPDFRSESGLYNKLSHLGLSDPQEVFDIALFREDPSIFYSIARDILPATRKFSPTHAFIKLLQDKGILLRNYTQNIDNLESYAGIDSSKLVQCHGSFASATCVTCGYNTDGESIFPSIRDQLVPKCPECAKNKPSKSKMKYPNDNYDGEDEDDKAYGVLKPDITFFGEALPKRFEELLLGGDSTKCDLLICIGTSLKVAPVSEIVRIIHSDVPQIYISKTPVHHNEFDITFLGNCDDAVELIAEKMGWELRHDMARRHLCATNSADEESVMTFPDGKIIYKDDEAVYEFVYRPKATDLIEESDDPKERRNEEKVISE